MSYPNKTIHQWKADLFSFQMMHKSECKKKIPLWLVCGPWLQRIIGLQSGLIFFIKYNFFTGMKSIDQKWQLRYFEFMLMLNISIKCCSFELCIHQISISEWFLKDHVTLTVVWLLKLQHCHGMNKWHFKEWKYIHVCEYITIFHNITDFALIK